MKAIQVDSSLRLKAPRELLEDADYLLIKEAFDIVTKYRNPLWMADISESEIQSDIIQIQGIILMLAEKLSMASSFQESEEDKVKVARSKVRLALKELKNRADATTPTKITADDIKDASIALTEELSSKYEDLKIASTFIKYVYYALKDHVQYLDKALQRMFSLGADLGRKQEYDHQKESRKSSISVSGSSDTGE